MNSILRRSAAAVLVLVGCASPRRSATVDRQPAPAAASTFSVYDLGSSWKNQRGDSVALSSLAGNPVILGLIYTHCSSTCPLIVEAMRRMEAKTSDAKLVLISLDPANDSPAALTAYAAKHSLDDRWTLLSGTNDSVQELTALLGARYRRVSTKEIAHTNTITVLDSSGRILSQQPSWDTAAALAALGGHL